MGISASLPIVTALLLAVMAALVSGDAEARHEIVSFVGTALKPQVSDLGGDPGYLDLGGNPAYLSGSDTEIFTLPPPIRATGYSD